MKIRNLFEKVSIICFVLTLVASIGFVGFVEKSEAKTVKIGSIYSLSGPGSEVNILMQRGVAMCKDWINAKGGITVKGEKYLIEIVSEDDKASAEGAVTAATKLVQGDKLKLILGQTTPFLVEATASVTEPNKVCYFASTHDTLSNEYPFTVSAYFAYATPKPILYDYLKKTYPKVKRVAITEIDEPSVMRAANAARAELKKRGMEDVGGQKYPFGAQDYYPILNKVLTLKPDAIDMNMEFPQGAATLVKQARELGFKGPILGNSPWDPVFVRDAIGKKEYATDFIFPTFEPKSAAALLPPITSEVVKLWTATYKITFDIAALRGWDPLWTLVQSIEAAQSFEPSDVIKAFEKMGTIKTSVGTAKVGGLKTFGINHMVATPCPLSRIQNGNVEFIGFFQPNIP
jgi:branched-chain amino acid transport system substrate-binding protein